MARPLPRGLHVSAGGSQGPVMKWGQPRLDWPDGALSLPSKVRDVESSYRENGAKFPLWSQHPSLYAAQPGGKLLGALPFTPSIFAWVIRT